jgi:hypothetical protein
MVPARGVTARWYPAVPVTSRLLRFMRTVALCGAGLVVACAACRTTPTPGEKCSVADQVFCPRHDRALVCEQVAPAGEQGGGAFSGAWVEVLCKGAQGCERRSASSECDDTVASEGDGCPLGPPQDYACTSDHGRALVCKDGRFGTWRECRGPEGCQVVDGRNVKCDTTLGEPGDPCAQKGTYSCSTDRKAMLTCDGSALVPASTCRGPAGCQIEHESTRVDCDDAIAEEGDPCDQARRIACSVDHKAELVCEANRYSRKRGCLRSDCRLDGAELFCD